MTAPIESEPGNSLSACDILHIWDGERGVFVEAFETVSLDAPTAALLRRLATVANHSPDLNEAGYELLFRNLWSQMMWPGAPYRCGCGCSRPLVGFVKSKVRMSELAQYRPDFVSFYGFFCGVPTLDAQLLALGKESSRRARPAIGRCTVPATARLPIGRNISSFVELESSLCNRFLRALESCC